MRADRDIRPEVELQIRHHPILRSSDIGVGAGVVTLTAAFVRTYPERFEAECDAKRAVDIPAIAKELEVRLPSAVQRLDLELAEDIGPALASHALFLSGVTQIFHHGAAPLEGQVQRRFQKEEAEHAAWHGPGVTAVGHRSLVGALTLIW